MNLLLSLCLLLAPALDTTAAAASLAVDAAFCVVITQTGLVGTWEMTKGTTTKKVEFKGDHDYEVDGAAHKSGDSWSKIQGQGTYNVSGQLSGIIIIISSDPTRAEYLDTATGQIWNLKRK